MRTIERAELAVALGIGPDQEGLPAHGGLADLVRLALARWGATREPTLRAWMRRNLEGSGYSWEEAGPRYDEVRAVLQDLGEIRRLALHGAPDAAGARDESMEGEATVPEGLPPATTVLLPGRDRFVPIGGGALLLGGAAPAGVTVVRGEGGAAGVARLVGLDGATREALLDAGFSIEPLRDWLGPPEARAHLGRRGVALDLELPEDPLGAGLLWDTIAEVAASRELPVSDPARMAVLAGPPGGYFGDAARLDGRWTRGDGAPAGLWLAASQDRRGLWLPQLALAEGGCVKAAGGLFNWDEWSWLLLGRGVRLGAPERIEVGEGTITWTCRLPAQLRRVARLGRVRGWTVHLPAVLAGAGRDLQRLLEPEPR